jgi:hypothetical protein
MIKVYSSLLVVFLLVSGAFSQSNGNLDKTKITVKFVSAPGTPTVTKTPLRYNKLFAFSCQLDDGGSDIYTNGFPFLNGGIVGGTTYPGLKYTDGCGNDIKFKMSSSLYSLDVNETVDIHDPVTGYSSFITWPQADEMYQNGWGISNHGINNNVGEFEYSVERNHSYVKLKTQAATTEGIHMGIFVNPNGDTGYTQYAIQNGYRVCYREGASFGKPSFDVTSNWTHGPLRMGRTQFYIGINIATLTDNMASASTGGAHHWGVAFSHSITNASYGYDFNTFRAQMTYIADEYGKGGEDNIWMTTEEEVLDYILLNPYLTVSTQKTGNDMVISFAGNLPVDFRFYAVSLLVNSNANVQTVTIQGPGTITYNGVGTNKSLINISWDKAALLPDTTDPAVKDAQKWVTKTEGAMTQQNANIAVDYVNILPNGAAKDGFRSRLCAIQGIIYPKDFCALSVEDGLKAYFDIYPNPAREELNISACIIVDKITLLSVLGKIVLEQIGKSRDVQINLIGLHAGIYFLKIDAGGQTYVRKIFISP